MLCEITGFHQWSGQYFYCQHIAGLGYHYQQTIKRSDTFPKYAVSQCHCPTPKKNAKFHPQCNAMHLPSIPNRKQNAPPCTRCCPVFIVSPSDIVGFRNFSAQLAVTLFRRQGTTVPGFGAAATNLTFFKAVPAWPIKFAVDRRSVGSRPGWPCAEMFRLAERRWGRQERLVGAHGTGGDTGDRLVDGLVVVAVERNVAFALDLGHCLGGHPGGRGEGRENGATG